MIVQADLVFLGLNTLLRDGLPAGAWMVEFFDKVKDIVHRSDVGIRAVIRTPFLVDGTGLEDAWEELVGDTDGRVGLAVFQKDVVSRIVFLDERIFEQQRIFLGVDYRVADIENLTDEYLCLEAVYLGVEVARHTILQTLGLADIESLDRKSVV